MTHVVIFNGSGHFCSRCARAWDREEDAPATCIEPADSSFLNGGPATETPQRTVIALCGEKGSGKDTAAAPLIARGFANVKMADGLKIMLRAMLSSPVDDAASVMLTAFLAYRGADETTIHRMKCGATAGITPTRFLSGRTPFHAIETLDAWAAEQLGMDIRGLGQPYRIADPAMIDRMIDGDLKETPSRFLNGRTPRHAMQTLGDWGREEMHRDFWLDSAMDRLDAVGDAVITDVRYPNEAMRVRGAGIPLFRIERPDLAGGDTHSSETQIRDLPTDGVLSNIAVNAEAFQTHAARFFAERVEGLADRSTGLT